MADPDGSGKISEADFMNIVANRPIKKRIEAALRKLFDEIDADHSGFITLDELKKLVKEAGFQDEISDAELKELFESIDGGDGKVSFEELLSAFMG